MRAFLVAILVAFAASAYAQREAPPADPRTVGPFPAVPAPTSPASCNAVLSLGVALANGWESAGFSATKDCMGIVRFSGALQNGSANSDAFILPIGWRPAVHEIYPAGTTSYARATVYVTPDGIVTLVSTATFISLSGITFKATD